MPKLALLPVRGLPPSGYPAGCDLEWFFADTAQAYRARGGHPVYGEHDIRYRLNGSGYRCPEFEETADIRVVAIGCSYVFGAALRAEDLFHERFAARLRSETGKSVVSWNLGLLGASNDYIHRMMCLAVRALDPDVVLVHFTHMGRREYLSVDNTRINYTPKGGSDDPVIADIFGHFRALSSRYDDLLNFFRSYKGVESLLHGRTWLFSTADADELRPVFEHLDATRHCGELPRIDTARDHAHPGPRSHEALFRAYWDRFVALSTSGV